MKESKFKVKDAYKFYCEKGYVNKTKCTVDFCEINKIKFKDSYRRMLSVEIKKNTLDEPIASVQSENGKIMLANIDGYLMDIQEYCEYYGLPHEDVKKYKLVTHSGSGAYYNVDFLTKTDKNYLEVFKERLFQDMNNILKSPVNTKYTILEDGKLLVVDIADLHIGKYASQLEVGEEGKYDINTAVNRALLGVDGILRYASGFNIEQILFVGGNDILHTDNAKGTTTSGTVQDYQGMWFENFLIAKEVYIRVLEKLRSVAKVHYMHNPSNHDYTFGFMLSDVIKTFYKDCKDVTFDSGISHRKYYKYYDNLIATTHGDGGKLETLPMTIANECGFWSECKRRYAYVHHFHHKINKDYPGITIEAVRSPSGTDSWHHRNQFSGAKKSIEGFVHDKEKGQIARFSYNF